MCGCVRACACVLASSSHHHTTLVQFFRAAIDAACVRACVCVCPCLRARVVSSKCSRIQKLIRGSETQKPPPRSSRPPPFLYHGHSSSTGIDGSASSNLPIKKCAKTERARQVGQELLQTKCRHRRRQVFRTL